MVLVGYKVFVAFADRSVSRCIAPILHSRINALTVGRISKNEYDKIE